MRGLRSRRVHATEKSHALERRARGSRRDRTKAVRADAWRETPFFTERERAALEWTESLTRVSQTHVPDEIYEKVRKHFSEKEIIDLTIVVGTINTWNRLAISMRAVPGEYQAKRATAS
jgi:alkylhydroperoxidase family enzyme